LPRDLNDIVRRVRENTFSLHVDHPHIDPLVNRLVLGVT
jgi:ubiquinone biosynthesis protein